MELSNGRNLLVERPASDVWVVRLTRPDPREQLDGAGIEDCDMYKDLHAAVLSRLAPGDSVVLNFGLVYWFPTSFYKVLLRVREGMMKRKSRMLLCGFMPRGARKHSAFQGR